MKTTMLGLLAETPIHPGAGRGMGVVDLPVAREAATDYPVLVGSSLKGALREKMETAEVNDTKVRFGRPDHAGDLLVSDARLLLLPVRSLTGSYRWATCPHLVERYRRDLARAGLKPRPEVSGVNRYSVLAAGKGALFLEERQFTISGAPSADLAKCRPGRTRATRSRCDDTSLRRLDRGKSTWRLAFPHAHSFPGDCRQDFVSLRHPSARRRLRR